MNLVSSQEPEAPQIAGGAGPARTRTQTRRSKLVEETQQNEILPTGDEAEVREVREVREVVKRVAVVRDKAAKGTKGAATPGGAPHVEEVPTDEEKEEEREKEAAPAPKAHRRSGRVGGKRQDTATRLGEELDEVMARGVDRGEGTARGARRAGAPGATVQTYEEEIMEEGGEEEAGGDEGIAAEEPPGAQPRAAGAGAAKEGRTRGRRASQVAEPVSSIPGTEEMRPEELEETQAEEPPVPQEWVAATQEAIAEEGGGVDWTQQGMPGEQEGEIYHTPEDAAMGAPEEGEGAAAPAPVSETRQHGRGRGKMRSKPQGAPAAVEEEEGAGPTTPAKLLRGALAGVADTFRGVLPPVLGGTTTTTAAAAAREEAPAHPPEAARKPRPATKAPAAKVTKAPKKTRAPAASAPRQRGRKGGKRREESYKRYLFKVLKQIHPELGISSKAMSVMHTFVTDQFDRIVEEAARLTMVGKHKTLTAREVQTAVRLVLPGELAKHAVAEGKKAVGRTVGVNM